MAKKNTSSDQKDTEKPVLAKQMSKDGKVKSKNFNLFAQFSGDAKAEQKAISSAGDSSANEASDDDAVSEKLVKQIAESINSYSLDKASHEEAE